MKIPALLSILFCFYLPSSYSQTTNPGSIKVVINDDDTRPVEGATVILMEFGKNEVYRTAISDNTGKAIIENIALGKYTLTVSSVGFDKYLSPEFSLTETLPSLQLADIKIKLLTQNLTEVVVEAKTPFIEKKLDRLIVNVGSSVVASGGTLLEALEKAPGVVTNQENSINLNGKQGLIVMIDGKPSSLSGADLISYLKSIPANSVDQLEIMANPSSKYDAAGNAGLINIKLKRDQRFGLNGNVALTYGQGTYRKPSASLNINYRDKRWNFFGNYGRSEPIGFTRFDINRKFFSGGSLQSVFDQSSFIKQPLMNNFGKIGGDYFLGKNTTIGFITNFVDSRSERNGSTNSLITNPAGNLVSTTLNNNQLKENRRNLFFNFNLKQVFGSTGRELTLDGDVGNFHSKNLQGFTTEILDRSGSPVSTDHLKTDQFGSLSVKSIKGDYLHPLSKKSKIEAGFKSSLVTTDNDIQFFTGTPGSQVPDLSRSNHFIYSENVNAAYLNYSKQFTSTDIQTGLRTEHTNTDGSQVTSGQSFSRNYVSFFPTLFVNQKLSKSHQLSLSYRKSIDRPSYRNLNPFRLFVDTYTYVVGDPELKPMINNNFELAYTLKSKYIFTASYGRTKDVIVDIFQQDDVTRISNQIPANLQTFKQYSLSVNAPFEIGKLNSNINTSVFQSDYRSPLQGGNLQNKYFSWNAYVNNSLSMAKGWSAELTGYYNSKVAYGLFTIRNLAQVSAGIQKTTTNKMSTFRLSGSDLFSTNHVAVLVKYQNMDFFTDRRWDSQVVNLSFTQRFGKSTVGQARRRNTGVEDEKRRAG